MSIRQFQCGVVVCDAESCTERLQQDYVVHFGKEDGSGIDQESVRDYVGDLDNDWLATLDGKHYCFAHWQYEEEGFDRIPVSQKDPK